MSRRLAIGALLFVFSASGLSSAQAAVLVCERLIEGSGREAVTEPDARKAALADWQAKAGATFTWRLATNKGITCLKAANGNTVCRASGHPCALHQVPPAKELKRLMPNAPGNGI